MNRDDPDCAWVHAYLHRVEGDLGNARYWLWTAIAATLLADSAAERALNAGQIASRGGVSGQRPEMPHE